MNPPVLKLCFSSVEFLFCHSDSSTFHLSTSTTLDLTFLQFLDLENDVPFSWVSRKLSLTQEIRSQANTWLCPKQSCTKPTCSHSHTQFFVDHALQRVSVSTVITCYKTFVPTNCAHMMSWNLLVLGSFATHHTRKSSNKIKAMLDPMLFWPLLLCANCKCRRKVNRRINFVPRIA